VKVSFGFILLIAGILGVARGGIDPPPQNLGHVIGTGTGAASLVTLAAVFLLVVGVFILKRTGRFSFEGSRGHARTDPANDAPPVRVADVPAADETT